MKWTLEDTKVLAGLVLNEVNHWNEVTNDLDAQIHMMAESGLSMEEVSTATAELQIMYMKADAQRELYLKVSELLEGELALAERDEEFQKEAAEFYQE